MMDLFLTNMQLFTSQELNWWSRVVWIIVKYLSAVWSLFWWHPFTAEDPWASKWCNAKFLQMCSEEETNSFTFGMTWMRVNTFLANFHFWVNCFFKMHLLSYIILLMQCFSQVLCIWIHLQVFWELVQLNHQKIPFNFISTWSSLLSVKWKMSFVQWPGKPQ